MSIRPTSILARVFLTVAMLVAALTPVRAVDDGAQRPDGALPLHGQNTLQVSGITGLDEQVRSPLRIWTDEYLRMWVYDLDSPAYMSQDPENTFRNGSLLQYFDHYQTVLRIGFGQGTVVCGNHHSNTSPYWFKPVSHVMAPDGQSITTVVSTMNEDITITHTVSYVDGQRVLRHDWVVTNTGKSNTTFTNLALRYGGDTFRGGSDESIGFYRPDSGFLYCAASDEGTEAGLMGMQEVPGSAFDGFIEGYYSDVDDLEIGAMFSLSNFPTDDWEWPGAVNYNKETDFDDNGMAVEWRSPQTGGTLAPGGSYSVALLEKWTEAGSVQVIAPGPFSAEAGTQHTLTFTVQNLSGISDVGNGTSVDVAFNVIIPEGWSNPGSIGNQTIRETESISIPVDIAIPMGTGAGIYQVALEAYEVETNVFLGTDQVLVTVLAEEGPTAPIVEDLPSASGLPLSQGERTVYTAISPSTTAGINSVLAALSGADPRLTRAFAWDVDAEGGPTYVDLSRQQPAGGVTVSTGIFIATRVPLSYNLNGLATLADFHLTIKASGWTFAGIPPVEVNQGSYESTYAWPYYDQADQPDADLLQVYVSWTADVGAADAMGTPDGPEASSQPYLWNPTTSRYEQVHTLEAGKGYWFKNNLNEDITISIYGQIPSNQVAMLQQSLRKRGGVKGAFVRDQGSPPPPPSSAKSTAAESSSSGGCGAGSGVASFALMLMLVGLRFLVIRR